jgi:endogenous inhibitor of DNA gyrase (YacG/DUF329 family)
MDKAKIVCPHCHEKNTWHDKNPFKPFCSERCKLIDFGGWANEGYRIAGDNADVPDENDNNEVH